MSDRKQQLSLPEDLILSSDRSSPPKDQVWEENITAEEKVADSTFTDDSKDQVGSDNIIPLSPQWLYAKPVDAKPGETRPPNSSSDALVKDTWRLDGSQEKKDWRKGGVDVESGRRWREEERDTGLLGRREQWRKDFRGDGVSTRDVSENRGLQSSSDKRSDSNNRTSGVEPRRDSKWSSRWGPEDKEKDSLNEKRTDAEKEDTHSDKEALVSGNRSVTERENDSREKWRPRHRMETLVAGSSAHRLGSEKGRLEVSYVGFTAGRGKSISNGSLQAGRNASASPIGSVSPVTNRPYSYPRAKLLDIYRQKSLLPNFGSTPDGMEHASRVTQEVPVKPLAFATPDADEGAVLEDMRQGKITGGSILHSPSNRNGASGDNISGNGDGNLCSEVNTDEIVKSLGRLIVNHSGQGSGVDVSGTPVLEDWDDSRDGKQKASLQFNGQLPNDSSSLFDFPSVQRCPSSAQFPVENNVQGPPLRSSVSPEDLSLCYLDPQGSIQGPYLGIDIITWFEQGYFQTDLPVRLSDAPDRTPFYELGDIMPQLRVKIDPASNSDAASELKPSDAVRSSLEDSMPEVGAAQEDQQWPASGMQAFSGVNDQSSHGFSSGFQSSANQRFQNLFHDDILLPERSESSSNLVWRTADSQGFVSSPSTRNPLHNHFSEPGIHSQRDEDAHPFGLLMSELRGDLHLQHTHPSNMASSIGVQSNSVDPLLAQNQASLSINADYPHYGEMWDTHTSTNIQLGSADAHRSSPRDQEFNDFDLQKKLMVQKLQMEQQRLPSALMSHHALLRSTGSSAEQVSSHLLELQFQQQRQLELQQQRQLELQQQRQLELQQQQQQRRLELQQQRQLELQQQRQLELQQQRQMELQQQRQMELQQRRQMELQQRHQMELQQRLQMELQEQHRQLELQEQRRHLELQEQRQLEFQEQQQLRQYQLKLQQQQQQMVLEQLLQHQMSDAGFSSSDPVRENLLDELQFMLQENSRSSRHLDLSLEQIITQVNQNSHREPQPELLDLLAEVNPGHMRPSDYRLRFQQEHLQAQQLSLSPRQQLEMEGKRHPGGLWSVDETDLLRDHTSHQRAQSGGFSSLDSYQHGQRLSSQEEHLGAKWGHTLQEQCHQHGFHEPSSGSFERQTSHPSVTRGMRLENINGHHRSAEQLDSFSSGVPPPRQVILEDLYGSHSQVLERYLSGNNAQVENGLSGKGMRQFHIETEQQRNAPEMAPNSGIWGSAGVDETQSTKLWADQQKFGVQSTRLFKDEYQHPVSTKLRENIWPNPESYSSSPFNHRPDQEMLVNNSFLDGSQILNNPDAVAMGTPLDHLGNGERMILWSKSGALKGTSSTVDPNLQEAEGKGSSSFPQVEDNLEQTEMGKDFGDANSRHSSRPSSRSSAGGNGSLYSYEMGLDKPSGEVVSVDRAPATLTKGLDTSLHKRPPVSRALSSHDVFSDGRQRIATNSATSNERRYESSGNTSGTLSRRSSSYNDTSGSESSSFIDALKKPVISEADIQNIAAATTANESAEGSQAGRSNKKKGKKGRQIDPALLGFKVSSNRIMMGEIQGLDD